MGSKHLQTREAQKSRYVRQLEARQGNLKEKGLPDGTIAKDSQIKHFSSKIKQIDAAMARVAFLENQTKMLKEKKEKAKVEAEQAASEPETGKKKGKKKAEPEGKGGKKKTKEGEKKAKGGEKAKGGDKAKGGEKAKGKPKKEAKK